jgi:hypothetical protein
MRRYWMLVDFWVCLAMLCLLGFDGIDECFRFFARNSVGSEELAPCLGTAYCGPNLLLLYVCVNSTGGSNLSSCGWV